MKIVHEKWTSASSQEQRENMTFLRSVQLYATLEIEQSNYSADPYPEENPRRLILLPDERCLLQVSSQEWMRGRFETCGDCQDLQDDRICTNIMQQAFQLEQDYEYFSIRCSYQELDILEHNSGYGQPIIIQIEVFIQQELKLKKPLHLKGCEALVQHLGAIVNDQGNRTTLALQARKSPCRVLGCKMHVDKIPEDFSLRTLFSNLENTSDGPNSDAPSDNMAKLLFKKRLRSDSLALSGQPGSMLSLPNILISRIAEHCQPRDLHSLAAACSTTYLVSQQVAPGLKLTLYPHQKDALQWMVQREGQTQLQLRSMKHPFCIAPRQNSEFHLDTLTSELKCEAMPTTRDCRGGMFCDEPGLGKTVTVMALILRTKGAITKMDDENDGKRSHVPSSTRLRSQGARRREVTYDCMLASSATLIVVPDTLLQHWREQFERHICDAAGLRTYFDTGTQFDLPDASFLATFDVVFTTCSRLTQQWQYFRPACALEQRMPVRYGFEGQRTYNSGTQWRGLSELLRIHWCRIIVDEGHKLGGLSLSHQCEMSRCLSADKRWVMTGTPTPQTLVSADLKHLSGLLVFLRILPYGSTSYLVPWNTAIQRPFEKKDMEGWARLKFFLRGIMIRHSKEGIRTIPLPKRRTVVINPSRDEYQAYNAVCCAARSNLLITRWDSYSAGALHGDSLLNPANRKYAMEVLRNLRVACCGGIHMTVNLSSKNFCETLSFFYDELVRDQVRDYLQDTELGRTTPCHSCNFSILLLMIIPECGHLVCVDCLETYIDTAARSSCPICERDFDWTVFQKLQPGFEYKWSHPMVRKKDFFGPENVVMMDSKAAYVTQRLINIRKEQSDAKVLIFSQFIGHILSIGASFDGFGVPYSIFLPNSQMVNKNVRTQELIKFQNDPNINVLLMTDVGAHGLDLSFVTHIFLMDEIWDSSLEDQVIARAYRMGAKVRVQVEDLVMRDSVEDLMKDLAAFGDAFFKEGKDLDFSPPADIYIPERKQHENASKKRKRSSKKSNASTRKLTINERRMHYILRNLRFMLSNIITPSEEIMYTYSDCADTRTDRRFSNHPTALDRLEIMGVQKRAPPPLPPLPSRILTGGGEHETLQNESQSTPPEIQKRVRFL